MNIATEHDDMFPVNPKLAWNRLRVDYKKARVALEQAQTTIDRLNIAVKQFIAADVRVEQLEAGIRQIQENYMKRGLIKRLTSQLLVGDNSNG